jgi:hypothetical protein
VPWCPNQPLRRDRVSHPDRPTQKEGPPKVAGDQGVSPIPNEANKTTTNRSMIPVAPRPNFDETQDSFRSRNTLRWTQEIRRPRMNQLKKRKDTRQMAMRPGPCVKHLRRSPMHPSRPGRRKRKTRPPDGPVAEGPWPSRTDTLKSKHPTDRLT